MALDLILELCRLKKIEAETIDLKDSLSPLEGDFFLEGLNVFVDFFAKVFFDPSTPLMMLQLMTAKRCTSMYLDT